MEKPTIALSSLKKRWQKRFAAAAATQFFKARLSFIVITMEHRLFHCFANLGDFWMFF